MKRVCVFCGSKSGAERGYADQARRLGRTLVDRGYELVYGGGSVGLMGVVADAVLESGGHVIGVLPKMLATKELLHTGVQDMRIVDSMHARKALMTELSDAFIAMPGGFGTFEELFEVVTWAQLGIHAKPIGLLNGHGYYDRLVDFLRDAVDGGFIKPSNQELIVVGDAPETLLDRLERHRLPKVKQWIAPDET